MVRSESYSANNTEARAASGVPGAASNIDALTEEDPAADTSEALIDTIRNYEVDRTVSYQRQDAFRLSRVNVSVILNSRVQDANSDSTLSAVEELVRNAVGINLDRGDRTTVRTLPFFADNTIEEDQPVSVVDTVREGSSMMPVIALLVVILLLIIGGSILYGLRKRRASRKQAELTEDLALLNAGSGQENQDEEVFSKIDSTASDRVRDLAVSSPDQIATILERWIKEAD